MAARWLNLFFRYSGYTYNLKQKIVTADGWLKATPYAVILIISEMGFAIISLPMYLIVRPEDIQEEGAIFPRKAKAAPHLQTYAIRRKISLATLLPAGVIFTLKLVFIGIVSFYLLGVQQLLADTQDWTFDAPGDYTYDSSKIEVAGGVARLKNIGSTATGSTTNPFFTADATGWTYADWLNNASASGAYSSSGGNAGGNVQITLSSAKNKITAGYYSQLFVTTVSSPDTATLNLDWSSISFSAPAAFDTYKLYAFIDAASGMPTLGQEVWSSGEITGTTAWAGSATIDIASKVPIAGTYYLKIVAYHDTPGTTGTYTTVAGFDNVIVNWSKTTVAYASDKPTTTPVTSLTMSKTMSWDSFTETATKNGGEIYYQLSSDNGANWKFWNGSAWATSTLATDYNIASDVNTRISSFATTTNQIKWRAFLSSSGSQQVILDNIAIGYTPNTPPQVQSLAPAQNTQYGYVYAGYNLVDAQSDPSSLVTYEYSLNGTFSDAVTMTASTTDPSHNGVSSLTASPSGVAHTFVWDARSQLGNVYNASVYVRLRANDGIGSGNYATSSAFAVDFVSSTVSNVVASETLGTTTVQITYDLFDNTSDNITVELQISGDGGSTWTVPATSVSGDIGSAVTSGNGKSISWRAGTDYPSQNISNMRVRVRAKDKFQNQGAYASSADFALDTLSPATLVAADLQAQPNAGDTNVLIGGSFTEVNPNTNGFSVAISAGAYSATTTGDTDTATPSNQSTAVGATLDGNDYISKVKIVHTDDYGLSFSNENLTPSTTLKYVKPYTPSAPTLSNPVTTRLDLQIVPNAGEASDVEYAIFETSTNKFVQSDGTLGGSPVWQVMGTGSSQWGNGLSVSGKVRVTGLSSPVANYVFRVKSRNPSDAAHAASSESAYSAAAQIANTAPAISLNTYAQTTDGTQYVAITYTGTDGQGDISSLSAYEYNVDGSTWQTMTEKIGVGSDGTANLTFLPGGSAFAFAWNSGSDLPDVETSTAKIRLKGNDTLADGSLSTSNNFTIDNKAPVVSGVTATQTLGTRTVAISYALADANNSSVEVDISSNGGSTWIVATTTLSGAVGTGVTPGGKSVSWNAATDYNGQYNASMQVRIRASDAFGNQGGYAYSGYYTVDTHAPVLANLTAAQDSGATTFTYHYDLTEDASTSAVVLSISADSGSNWTVATTTASGNIGSGQANGTGKTIAWNAGTDYNSQEKSTMRFRLTANDIYGNSGVLSSSDFNLDTLAPRIANVSGVQPLGDTLAQFAYDLADQNLLYIELDISSDNGSSWAVATTTLSGELGAGRSPGANKIIAWNAWTDFSYNNSAAMKIRVRGRDSFNNQSDNAVSGSFNIDTLPPAILALTDLQAQPLAGDVSALIGGSFTETNPNANDFYAAINGGSYGSVAAGTSDTAAPSNLLTPAGKTLNGSDYISGVKITHTDDYGLMIANENSTPSASYKYVKPYAPAAPTVYNPAVGSVTVGINKNASEVDGLEYAIYEITSGKYIQSNGVLGTNAVWQLVGTASVNQWGFYLGSSGQIRVTGLTNPSYTYQFQVKSRNWRDGDHAASSESALSSSASSANQSPTISINSSAQSTDGSKYVTINYTGTDLESDACSLVTYQYSTDNSTWHNMTEKTGVGSEGKTGLAFTSGGQSHNYMWDVATDLNNTEDDTVYVRLKANDGTSDGGLAASSAFTVDTKAPVVASVSGSQNSNSNIVAFSYNLTDFSNSTVSINISSSSGSTWNVATSTASGDVGNNIGQGSGKAIAWNPGSDFSGQEATTMRAQIGARDNFGNQGSYAASANFNVDTKSPVFANVAASQVVSSSNVRITYDISDANNSTVAMDISSDGGSTWNVASSSVTGNIGSVVPGDNKEIIWDAGSDFPNQQISNMQVRLRAVDAYANMTGNVASNLFAINTEAPIITSVTAVQTVGTDNVAIGYNLFDANNVAISIDISSDGGSTWTVATSSMTGDVGFNIAPGLLKSVTWNAGVNFNNQQNSNMKVRIRGTNTYGNTSSNNLLLGVFSIDTLAPAILTAADLQSQPNAGDTTALIGGSFTEANPINNYFVLAINGGAYAATTTGQSDTSAPASQATQAGATLTGHDYISKVKIVETDNYGHQITNENTAPAVSYKYVKPYAPSAPTVNNPTNSTVDLTINAHAGEASDVEYAIYEISTDKYAQADGSLASGPIWQIVGTSGGQWGNTTGVSGKISVTGLNSPVAQYSFKVKSRNPSDGSHAVSSESDFSATSGITNSAPAITITSAAQQLSGGYVLINYTGTDAQNDTNNIIVYQYSTNNISWQTMTQKSGVGSNGTSSLIFSSAGTAYVFAWDAAADLPNQEQPTVYVRLKSNDGLVDSSLEAASAFYVDTRGPVISNISASQAPNSSIIIFTYDLADSAGSDNTVAMDISSDGGSSWTVAKTTLSGDVGAGVTAGAGRTATWNAAVDFAGQENNTMQVRIRGTDSYGNVGSYLASGNFIVDTGAPAISGVSASQNSGSTNVSVNYTLIDLTPAGHLVEFLVSADSGATWNVATSTRSGDVGSGQTTGAKTFAWNAGTDYSGHDLSSMRVKVRSKDYFGNQGSYDPSANFSLDTATPIISNITAAQNSGLSTLTFHYDLNESAQTNLDISSDGGASWNVAKTTIAGDINSTVAAGAGKTVTWNAGTDYNGQENSTMRYRIRGIDGYGNTSSYFESGNFSIDTGAPLGLLSLNKFSETATTVTLNWQAVTDAHFNHFELWHGSTQADVVSRSGTASIWTVANDANLTNPLTISTVITGLNVTADYYVKIFAVDDYGNALTVADLNIYTPPAPTPAASAAVGAVAIPQPLIPPGAPILSPLPTPTRNTTVTISGLAAPRTRVDLYDNGNFVGRFNSVADSSGRFSQTFNFAVGNHILTARAVDFNNLTSPVSALITLNIVTTAPPAPIVLSPQNNSSVTDANPTLIGVAEGLANVEITLDGRSPVTVAADVNGAWSYGVPSDLSLADGSHIFAVRQIDSAGNASPITRLTISKISAPALAPGLPAIVAPVQITQPVPPSQLINETAQAVELPGIPVPTVTAASSRPVVTGDFMSFSGTSIPNTDVVVYIHSAQALIYRARTDSNGSWTINHSQATAELAPGEHTIYAVAVDTSANVKSRPSAVSSFTVERNFWVMIFQTLNLRTTAITLVVLLLTILWLYRIRKLRGAAV